MIDHAHGMLEIKRFYEKAVADLEASQSVPREVRSDAFRQARDHLMQVALAALETVAWLNEHA